MTIHLKNKMQYIFFHGSFGNPQENWLPWLKEHLEKLGPTVLVPAFPVDTWEHVTELGQHTSSEIQNLNNWLKTFDEFYKQHFSSPSQEKICFIGHSLACVFILHILEKYNLQLDSAIFVAPFLDKLEGVWQIDNVNDTFYKSDFDFEKLQKLIPISYSLYSSNDPYVPIEKALTFAKKLTSSLIEVKNAGHFNIDAGFPPFPLVLELCKTRFME